MAESEGRPAQTGIPLRTGIGRSALNDLARIGKQTGDWRPFVAAAREPREPALQAWRAVSEQQALCLEALAILGPAQLDDDPGLTTARTEIAAHLDALSSGWGQLVSPVAAVERGMARKGFDELLLAQRALRGPDDIGRLLDIADSTLALGRAAADGEITAWGHAWRIEALQQQGQRHLIHREFAGLVALVERTCIPTWAWRVAMMKANFALVEHRLEDASELAVQALDIDLSAAMDERRWADLIVRSEIAVRSGNGLPEIEVEVRRAIATAPVFAQGWRALLLLRMGRRSDAIGIWRMLGPHLDDVPKDTVEWLMIQVGHVDLAMAADDRAAVHRLRDLLTPYADLHIGGSIVAPYGGPVSLALAKAAQSLGDHRRARKLATDARERSLAMGAPWFVAEADRILEIHQIAVDPLSPREAEVARLVALGLSNRSIAERMVLSERTVEQHVRSSLRKLGVDGRAGIAAWVTDHRASSRNPA